VEIIVAGVPLARPLRRGDEGGKFDDILKFFECH
jgi:hypothetical protein